MQRMQLVILVIQRSSASIGKRSVVVSRESRARAVARNQTRVVWRIVGMERVLVLIGRKRAMKDRKFKQWDRESRHGTVIT